MCAKSVMVPSSNKDKNYLGLAHKLNKKEIADNVIKYIHTYYFKEQKWTDKDDYYFVITRLHPDQKVNNEIKKEFYFTLKELRDNPVKVKNWIMNNVETFNLYHTIFIYNKAKRKDEFAVKETRVVYLDIDKKGHSLMTEEDFKKVEEIVQKYFDRYGINYSLISSGRGLHIKIVLDKPLSEQEWRKMALLTYIFENTEYNADNIYDFARIIRLPYSLNQNSGLQANIVKETDTVTEKEKLIQLINEIEVEQKRKRTEKLYSKDVVYDLRTPDQNLTEEKIAEMAKEVYLVIKNYYKKGTRHNLFFLTLATVYKYTKIDTDELRLFAEKLLELLDDEEQKQRLSIVKSLVQQERSSGRESIATVSFFFVEDENGNIIEDRRLSQFAQTNNMSPEEAKETIRKIILDILGIIGRYGEKFNKNFIGRAFFRTGMRSLKAIEVYRDKIQIATYKVTDDGQFTLVSREKLLNAKMELKEIVIKEDETGMEEWRYTLVVTDLKDGQRHTIVRKPLNEVARWLAGTTLASVASKNTLESALQQILNILRDYYNIRKIYESESFKFYVDINSNKYTHNAAKFFNQVYSVEDTRDYRERITDDDVRKFLETLSAIKDDKIFFVSVGAMISALFNNEKNIKRPLIWLWSPAVSIGKSTLATLLTTKAWGIKKLSASEAESAFRMLKLLSVGHLLVSIDDVVTLDKNILGFIKSYLSGDATSVTRGKANLEQIIYNLKASLLITSNKEFNAAFMDGSFVDTGVLDRIIQLKVPDDEYIFETEQDATSIRYMKEGIGFKIADNITEILNEQKITFTEMIKLNVNTLRQILAEADIQISYRRAELYTQFAGALAILREIARAYGVKKLSNKITNILSNIADVIKSIEDIQNATESDDITIYIDKILDKVLNADFIPRTARGNPFVTTTAFKLLKQTTPILDNVYYTTQLVKFINKRYPGVAKYKSNRINGQTVKGVEIDLIKLGRYRKIDNGLEVPDALAEEVYQTLKDLKGQNINISQFTEILIERFGHMEEREEIEGRVRELLLTKFRKHIEIEGKTLDSNSENIVFKVRNI